MKLLLDANLSPLLAARMQTLFPGSMHVRRIGALGMDDDLIWEHARRNDFTIVSKDSDFYYKSALLGAPPKIVWLKVRNATTAEILNLLVRSADIIRDFQSEEILAFLVLE